jgi:hypothetical protein
MMDFIKMFPSVTIEEYMWKLTIPQIKLSQSDYSHTNYLSEEEAEYRRGRNLFDKETGEMRNDLGMPIIIDNG